MTTGFTGWRETTMEEMLDDDAIWDAYRDDEDSTTIGDQQSARTSITYPPYVQSQPAHSPVAMDNLDFLKLSPGNASLTIILPDEVTVTISDLDPNVISQQCPLLAVSFEAGLSGAPKASIEVPSLIVAICFLRYCYTGSYMPNWDSIEDNSNCTLLIHAQLCHIGEIFDAPGLQAMAHFNVIRETEISCCRPSAPADLVTTIRYIFDNLASQKGLIDTVINYCVNCFQYHRLGSNAEFRKMAYELQEFTKELSRVNMQRDFLDDGASEIIQLPCIPTEHSEAAFNRKVLGDFVFEIFSADPSAHLYAPPTPPVSGPSRSTTSSTASSTTSTPHLAPTHPPRTVTSSLALRPKSAYLLVPRDGNASAEDSSSSSSEDEDAAFAGFTLVRRPRDHADTYVEPESGRRFSAYDDSDTETLTGKEEMEDGEDGDDDEEEAVLVPAVSAASVQEVDDEAVDLGSDAELVVVEREPSVKREPVAESSRTGAAESSRNAAAAAAATAAASSSKSASAVMQPVIQPTARGREKERLEGEMRALGKRPAAAAASPGPSEIPASAKRRASLKEGVVTNEVDGDWDMIF